jgi:hypothetical protein
LEKGFSACSELVAEAAKAHLRIAEVGITYKPRIGETKLNPVSAGTAIFWSSLKMLIDYRPILLFGGIGLALIAVGFVVAWPVIIIFVVENRFVQLGRALIAMFCWIVGSLSIFTGIILNMINISFQRIRGRAK